MLVELITQDFIGSNYFSNEDCPLARCFIRLGYPLAHVGGVYVRAYDEDITHSFDDYFWNSDIINPLIKKANEGKEVSYSLELIEI